MVCSSSHQQSLGEDLLQEIDKNGDGSIDFEEFMDMMEQLGSAKANLLFLGMHVLPSSVPCVDTGAFGFPKQHGACKRLGSEMMLSITGLSNIWDA